ncbi:hypothetical protein LUZ61_020534 [Rhynchospora tenuis]|uniref:Pentatricopeptide repeat-containing protein n=1 Tax=Rhynchospora tenuis TaxID=198213 RepID=A0AAD5ZDI4_9POAL|nr:hypothetical protein LUZ61_020534 [Rhynchospora tenuis]
MYRYLKSELISNRSIGLLRVFPFLEKTQLKNKSFFRFFSAVAVLSQNLDYSSGEDKQSFPLRLNSTQVCSNLQKLRTNPSVAIAYFKDCESLGFCHDISTYTAIISILSSSNRKSRLVSLFSNLISLYTNPGHQILSSLFFSLSQSGGEPGLVSFALDALFKAYRTCRRAPQEAVDVFFLLGKLGFLPTLQSCNFLLSFVADAGKDQTLKHVFEQMNGFGINLDTYSFTILMKFYLNAKQHSEAIEVWQQMEKAGIKPDSVTYMTFLSGICACKRYDLSCDILQAMVTNGMQVSPKHFNIVFSGLCKESKLEEAGKLLQIMSKQGVQLDNYSYGRLIEANCAKGNLENFNMALDLCREMTDRGIGITPRIATRILQGLDKLGLNEDIWLFFEKFKELGVVPDRVLYNFALNALGRSRSTEEAMKLIQEMRNSGLEPDRKHYTCLIGGFRNRGDAMSAQAMFVEMLKLGLKPDTVTYNVLLSSFFSNSLNDKAIVLLGRMIVQGIELNVKENTYGLVIEGFCKGGRASEAELLFKVLRQRGSLIVQGIGAE